MKQYLIIILSFITLFCNGQEQFINGDGIPLMVITTNSSATFNPSITTGSGTVTWSWGDGSAYTSSNSPSHSYSSSSNKTVKIFKGSANYFTSLNFNSKSVVGTIDLRGSVFSNLGGTQDFRNNPGITNFYVNGNYTMSVLISGASFSSLDLSNVTYLYQVQAYSCANLRKLKLPNSLNTLSMGAFLFYSDDLDTLDCSGMPKIGGDIEFNNNSHLTYFNGPANVTGTVVVSRFYGYSCDIRKFDLSGWGAVLGGDFRIQSNPNDTSLRFPASINQHFTNINANGNALNQWSVDYQILHKVRQWLVGTGDVAHPQHPPTASLTINVGGGTNAIPTNTSDANDIATIYSNAGYGFTYIHR